MEEERKSLPIYRYREQFLEAVEACKVLVVHGGAVSGKGTQLPQYLHESGYTKKGKIGFTQPSDLAAFILARRVSRELGSELGQEVGYSTQYEVRHSDKTVIEYTTDKRLLREMIRDRKLTSYSVIIVDQAHERTVSTDLLLGLLKNLAKFRRDLKVIISGVFSDYAGEMIGYFNHAPKFMIHDEKPYCLKMHLNDSEPDFINMAASMVVDIHVGMPSGDILVFLQGQDEIEQAEASLRYKLVGEQVLSPDELIVCPVFANLSSEIQTKMFEPTPPGARKVVLLSDIVDAYLFDGIRYVIDTGIRKIKGYDPVSGVELPYPISKASAGERSDLCGMTGGGKCYRLYPRDYMNFMLDDPVPQIRLAGLAHAVLTLKSLGVMLLMCFDFMETPPIDHLLEAVDLLYALGAVNDVGFITPMGRKMAEFPVDPMLSKMMLASEKYKCSSEIITIAAILSVGRSPFQCTIGDEIHSFNSRRSFYDEDGGDHIALLKVYTSWAAAGYTTQWCTENHIRAEIMKQSRAIRDHFEGLLNRFKIQVTSNPNPSDLDGIKKAITAGFFLQAAKLQKNGSYEMVIQREKAFLYTSPSVAEELPELIVYHEVVDEVGLSLRHIIEVKPECLVEVAPHYYYVNDRKKAVGVKILPRGNWRATLH